MQFSFIWVNLLAWALLNTRVEALEIPTNASSFITPWISKSSPNDVTSGPPMMSSLETGITSSPVASSSSYARIATLETISSSVILSTKTLENISVSIIYSTENATALQTSVTSVPGNTTSTKILASVTMTIAPSLASSYLLPNVTTPEPTYVVTRGVDTSLFTLQPSSVTTSILTLYPSSATSSVPLFSILFNSTTSRPPITTEPKVKPEIEKTGIKKWDLEKGAKLALECAIKAGDPKPSIKWEKDNISINHKQGSPLTIDSVKPDDSGEYKCIAKNKWGIDEIAIDVNVIYISDIEIKISKHGSDQSAGKIKEGDHIDITCEVDANPPPAIRFSKNGKVGQESSVQGPVGNRRHKTTISLTKVSRKDDAGEYICKVSSGKASKESSKVLEIDLSSPLTYPKPDKLRKTANTITIPIHNILYLKNGMPVKHIQLVVLELSNNIKPKRESWTYKDKDLGPYKDNRSIPYIAGVFQVNDNKQEFVIGDGKKSLIPRRSRSDTYGSRDLYNVPLQPNKYYTAFQRMVAKDLTSFNSLPWIPPTKTAQASIPPTTPRSNFDIIIGCIIALLILLITAVLVGWFYFVRKRQKQVIGQEKYEMNGMGPLDKMARTFTMHMARINEHYHTPGTISVEAFLQHVARMHKSGDMLFTTEYEHIRDDNNIPATHCRDPANQLKNRFTNIVAYDHNRVKLIPYDDEPCSDYINASYIDGYDGKTYIATQGPLEITSGDFWRMVWEQDTRVIVMLTNVMERGRRKCFQYWPTSGSYEFDGVCVSLVEQFEVSSHTIRVLRVSLSSENGFRLIKQYHFTSWPDHGVPKSVAFLLSFVRETDKANPADAGPMVVHCSAGVGRTGTFIVIDTMLRQIENEKTVDIYNYVVKLRKQRNLMVQTEQQYIFIHDALYDAIINGNAEIHACNLRSRVQSLTEITQENEEPLIAKEFQRLTLGVKPRLTMSAANHSANKLKNRYHNTLPYDDTRVQLSVQVAVAGSDYVNASFIDGYRKKNSFIATQAPLPETFSDFWRMIWEQECCTIVTLAQETENTKLKMDRYWPTSHPITYGYLQVEFLEEEKKECFDLRFFKMTNNQNDCTRFVRQYHFMEWTSEDITDSESGLLNMIDDIQSWQRQEGDHVITVHCSAGVGRTGVFCAVSSLIERIKAEALVDVFTTVKLLREQRPAMVQTRIQYEYCYRVLLQYLDLHSSLEKIHSSFVDIDGPHTTKPATEPLESDMEHTHETFVHTSDENDDQDKHEDREGEDNDDHDHDDHDGHDDHDDHDDHDGVVDVDDDVGGDDDADNETDELSKIDSKN